MTSSSLPIQRVLICCSVAAVLLGIPVTSQAVERLVSSVDEAAEAVAAAEPGDVVVLADGTYVSQVFELGGHGTAEAPIVFRSATPGGAIFTGLSLVVISGRHVVVDGLVFDQAWEGTAVRLKSATECRLTNCAFIESGRPTSTYPRIISFVGGSQRNRVDHCYMQANLSIGIGVEVAPGDSENTHNQIDHNYFKDIIRRHTNGQETVQIGQGGLSDRTAQYTVVEYNLFDNASGDSEIISSKTGHNIIRYNTFRNCSGTVNLRGGSYSRVEGNYFFNCDGGVRVHDGHHVIVNNYMSDGKWGIALPRTAGDEEYTYYGPVVNCVVAHNTIINFSRAGISIGEEHTFEAAKWQQLPVGNDFIKNLVVSPRGTLIKDDGSYTTLWRGNVAWATDDAAIGLEHEGILQADPGLVREGAVLRMPSEGSPAQNLASVDFRNIGAPIPGADVDIDGQPRDAQADAGADEVSGAPILRRPLEAADVGPIWMAGDPGVIRRIADPQVVPPR